MDVQWKDGALVVEPKDEGERRVSDSVVDSLSGLNQVDINHRTPTSPDRVNLVDNQPVGALVDKSLEVIAQTDGGRVIA